MINTKNRKAMTAVVATALLIVVTVATVIGFQTWFGSFSSRTFVNVEQSSNQADSSSQIETLVGNKLYFKNNLEDNLSIKEIKVNGKVCNIFVSNLSLGIEGITLQNCTDNLTTNIADVIIMTDKQIFEKKVFLRDVEIVEEIEVDLILENWSTNWSSRIPIIINNSGAILTDFQINITLDTDALIFLNKMQNSCSDILITNFDGKTSMPYWLESGCNTSKTNIWIKVPELKTGENLIYLYYDNPSAVNISNGSSTFLYYEDFETISGNINGYDGWSGTAVSVTKLRSYKGDKSVFYTSDGFVSSTRNLGNDIVFEGMMYPTTTSSRDYFAVGNKSIERLTFAVYNSNNFRYWDGSWHSTSCGVNLHQWNKFMFIAAENKIKLYANNCLLYSGFRTSRVNWIGFEGGTAGHQESYFDTFRARKYSSNTIIINKGLEENL